MVCRWSSQVQLQQGTEPPCIWSLRYEQRCKPFFQFYKLQEMTCTSQNHFLISIGNSRDLKSQQSKARPSNILWQISCFVGSMHIPRRCKLGEIEGPIFQHSWRPGWLYGRPVGTSVSSWFPENSVVEATPRDIKECCVLFLYAFKCILYIICDPGLPTVFPVLSYPQ